MVKTNQDYKNLGAIQFGQVILSKINQIISENDNDHSELLKLKDCINESINDIVYYK